MRKWGFLALILIAAAFTGDTFAQSGADYYPLGMESYWVYKRISPNDSVTAPSQHRREVAGFQVDGESRVVSVKNDLRKSSTYQWFRFHPQGEVACIALSIGPDLGSALTDFDPPLVVLPKDIRVGNSWELKMTVSNESGATRLATLGVFRIESDRETVTVPAGTFKNCLKVKRTDFDEDGKESGTAWFYYAKGVGYVLSEQVEPESKRNREELTEYSVKE